MRPPRGWIALALLAACAGGPGGARTAAPTPTPATCPPPSAADLAVDVLHYDADLRVDPVAGQLSGAVRLDLGALSAGQTLSLDARDLHVSAVFDGPRALCWIQDRDRLRVRLAHPAAPGQRASIRVRYQAPPSRGLRLTTALAFTAFHTDSWLPCRFDPADKATLTLTLDVPIGWSVAASGSRQPDQARAGRRRTRFVLDRPHSASLFGFVAGPFSEQVARQGGVELRFLTRGRSAAEVSRIFAATGEAALEQAAGRDLSQFFADYVLGTRPLLAGD